MVKTRFLFSLWSVLLSVLPGGRLAAQGDLSHSSFSGSLDSSGRVFHRAFVLYKEASHGHSAARARFAWDVVFQNDTFRGRVDCQRIFFPDDASFSQSVFYHKSDFTRDTFGGLADFSGARFLGDSHFILATFENYADFSHAVFHGIGYFSDLNFADATVFDFTDAVLPDTLDFSANAKIPTEIDLSVAAFDDTSRNGLVKKKHFIYFHGSDISKFRLDYRHFQLLFVDPISKAEACEDEKESMYESLLKNFQDHGQLESYQLLDVEFQDYEWSTAPPYLCWLHIVPHYWNLYGHANGLIFLWTVVFLLLFTLISYRYLDFLSSQVYPVEKVAEAAPDSRQIEEAPRVEEKFRLSWRRFWAALIYTGRIFFLFSLDMDKFRFTYKRAAFYLLVVYTIGLVCIAYMANFVIAK